jgi:hypothetical protein
MHERREREKRTCIREERAINKIGLIILNILEKLSRLIIPNRGSIRVCLVACVTWNLPFHLGYPTPYKLA